MACPLPLKLNWATYMRSMPWSVSRRRRYLGTVPKVLANDTTAVSMRLQTQDRVELLRPVLDVSALAGLGPGRDPVQPVHRHHVVDSEDSRVLEVMAEAIDPVRIAVLADSLRMQRRERPILAFGKESVRRRSSRGRRSKRIRALPNVEAGRVNAQRQVEVEAGRSRRARLAPRSVPRRLVAHNGGSAQTTHSSLELSASARNFA